MDTFFELIAPYICESMVYKLSPNGKNCWETYHIGNQQPSFGLTSEEGSETNG